MKFVYLSACSAALLAGASPALADVSAAELWAQWQENYATTGQTLTADVEETSDGLILRNFTAVLGQATGDTTTQLSEIALVETGDGGVRIEPANPVRLTSVITDGDDELGTMEFLITFTDLNAVASGEIGNIAYDVSAAEIRMVDGEAVSFGDEAPDLNLDIRLLDTAMTYTLEGSTAEDSVFNIAASISGLTAALDGTAPDTEDGSFRMRAAAGDLDLTYDGTLNAFRAMQIADGGSAPETFFMNSVLSYSRFGYDIEGTDPITRFSIAMANNGGRISTEISNERLTYALMGSGLDFDLSSSDIPVPVSVNAESTRMGISIPTAPSDAPADMALNLDFNGVTMSEDIWGLFDPGAALPRDPAVLRLVATGTAQLFTSLIGFDPMQLSGPPGELRSVDLEDLEISAAGASLTGTGSVTFTPGRMIPEPVGSVELALQGLNGLLDRLTQAGLLPPEQAGMARGMAGMFARPGAAADTLESTIEFSEGGSITANGFPLR
ncbi:MAG: DUF2125 domain-containing protein [Pseudomonadota bacterium]